MARTLSRRRQLPCSWRAALLWRSRPRSDAGEGAWGASRGPGPVTVPGELGKGTGATFPVAPAEGTAAGLSGTQGEGASWAGWLSGTGSGGGSGALAACGAWAAAVASGTTPVQAASGTLKASTAIQPTSDLIFTTTPSERGKGGPSGPEPYPFAGRRQGGMTVKSHAASGRPADVAPARPISVGASDPKQHPRRIAASAVL